MVAFVGEGAGRQTAQMKIVGPRRSIHHLTAIRDRIAGVILESVELLATQPHMGRPGWIVGTRELVVPGTPYIIPYRVKGEQLELLAVFHGRQRWPGIR